MVLHPIGGPNFSIDIAKPILVAMWLKGIVVASILLNIGVVHSSIFAIDEHGNSVEINHTAPSDSDHGNATAVPDVPLIR